MEPMKLLNVLDHSSRLRSGGTSEGSDRSIDLTALATRIERDGIDAVGRETLVELARLGRASGLHPEVAAVIADSDAPAVVRTRVFGAIHRRLAVSPLGTDPVARLAA